MGAIMRKPVSEEVKAEVWGLAIKGWNQTRIAGKVGLSQGTVSRIISGKSYPTSSRLEYYRVYNGTRRCLAGE
jgi:hypothetical protein